MRDARGASRDRTPPAHDDVEDGSGTMGTAVMIETTTSSKLARTCVEASEPVVLTARSWLRARADLAHALRNAQFDLRFVAEWDRMPEAVERIAADIVLVDLDAAEATSRTTRGPSGYRLVSMLARQIAGRATALVVMTGLD